MFRCFPDKNRTDLTRCSIQFRCTLKIRTRFYVQSYEIALDERSRSLRIQVPLRTGRSVLMRSSPLSKAERSFNVDFCWHIYSAPQKYLPPNVLPPMSYRARFEFKLLWISEASQEFPFPQNRVRFITYEKRNCFQPITSDAPDILFSRGELSISFPSSLSLSLFLFSNITDTRTLRLVALV